MGVFLKQSWTWLIRPSVWLRVDRRQQRSFAQTTASCPKHCTLLLKFTLCPLDNVQKLLGEFWVTLLCVCSVTKLNCCQIRWSPFFISLSRSEARLCVSSLLTWRQSQSCAGSLRAVCLPSCHVFACIESVKQRRQGVDRSSKLEACVRRNSESVQMKTTWRSCSSSSESGATLYSARWKNYSI